MLWDWQEERELDLASEEVASAIREAQMLVKSGHEDITMAAMSVTFYCDEEAGRVSYLTKRGVKFIQPRGRCLPISVQGEGSMSSSARMALRVRKEMGSIPCAFGQGMESMRRKSLSRCTRGASG